MQIVQTQHRKHLLYIYYRTSRRLYGYTPPGNTCEITSYIKNIPALPARSTADHEALYLPRLADRRPVRCVQRLVTILGRRKRKNILRIKEKINRKQQQQQQQQRGVAMPYQWSTVAEPRSAAWVTTTLSAHRATNSLEPSSKRRTTSPQPSSLSLSGRGRCCDHRHVFFDVFPPRSPKGGYRVSPWPKI